MQHAAVATTLRDARLVWRAVDTGQLNLQVMIIIVVAAMAAVVFVVVVDCSVTNHHITASTSQRFVYISPFLRMIPLLQLWSMWQQITRSIHLHPILLNKADGKRIVLEAAQKDTKVSWNIQNTSKLAP
jgi:hypothetical protein